MDLGFAEEAEGSTARRNMEKLLCGGDAAQLNGKSLVLCFSFFANSILKLFCFSFK